MEPATTAALVSAGASLLGGLMGKSSQSKAVKKQIKYQREFAQHGVRWKVADAKAAGIHPLYALGASTPSFQPIAINDPLPQAIANMGQDIGRAMTAGTPQEQRTDAAALALAQQRAQLQNQELEARIAGQNLENDLARLRFARELLGPKVSVAPPSLSGGSPFAAAGIEGAIPPGHTGPLRGVKVNPSESTASRPGQPGVEAAATPGFKWQNVGNSRWLMPNSQLAEILEGMGAAGHVAGPLAWWQANWDARDLGTPLVRAWDWLTGRHPVYSGRAWRHAPVPGRPRGGR